MASTEDQEEEVFRYPFGITTDEEGNDKIRVCVVVQGLRAQTFGTEASNATVEVTPGDIPNKSLRVTVRMNDLSKGKFRWEAKQLVGEIDETKTTYKVKKDQVVIKLQKNPVEPWAARLADTGIDAHESSEDSDE